MGPCTAPVWFLDALRRGVYGHIWEYVGSAGGFHQLGVPFVGPYDEGLGIDIGSSIRQATA